MTALDFAIRRVPGFWGDIIDVLPWPDDPIAAYVTVLSGRDPQTGEPRVTVRYDFHPMPVAVARLWAQAILRACDIADQEANG